MASKLKGLLLTCFVFCFTSGIELIQPNSNFQLKAQIKGEYLQKIEFYKSLEKQIANRFPKWRVIIRGEEYLVIHDNCVLVPEASLHEKASTIAEEKRLAEERLGKRDYEIKIGFTPFYIPVFDNKKEQKGGKTRPEQLQSLKDEYNINNIYQDEITGLYTAIDRDEKNRLANFYIALQGLSDQPTAIPTYYVQGHQVEFLEFKPSYFRVYPNNVQKEADKIYLLIEDILLGSVR